MFNKVLVATDFSSSAKALPYCLFALCPNLETEIILTYITDDDDTPQSSAYHTAMEDLKSLEEQIQQAGYEDTCIIISSGEPFEEINRLAEEHDVGLVLAASHGKSYLSTTLMGSTTFDLARVASYPLFIEKIYRADDNQVPLLRKVLLPTDFSRESLTSLNVIRSLRENIDEVVVVNVIERSRNDKDLSVRITLAEQKLKELVDEIKLYGVKASYIVEKGTASKRLRHIAEDVDASLVIMSKTGGGLIKGLLLGSTSQNFALNSDRPILLLPADETEDDDDAIQHID